MHTALMERPAVAWPSAAPSARCGFAQAVIWETMLWVQRETGSTAAKVENNLVTGMSNNYYMIPHVDARIKDARSASAPTCTGSSTKREFDVDRRGAAGEQADLVVPHWTDVSAKAAFAVHACQPAYPHCSMTHRWSVGLWFGLGVIMLILKKCMPDYHRIHREASEQSTKPSRSMRGSSLCRVDWLIRRRREGESDGDEGV